MNKVTRNIEDIDNITEYTRKLAIKEKKLKKEVLCMKSFLTRKQKKYMEKEFGVKDIFDYNTGGRNIYR